MKYKQKKDGISLRAIDLCLIIIAVIIAVLMVYSTFHLTSSFRHLTEKSEEQIELRKAARELMDASDYLTEKVQRFTINGDMRFVDEYFEEAFVANRREEAIATMSEGADSSEALDRLKAAMSGSLELMNREYYAMKLVIEALGYEDYPDILQDVVLTADDQALSSHEKMHLAAEMVHDDEYYEQKDRIRKNMRDSLDELEQMAYETDASALESLGNEMLFVRIVIAIQTIAVFFLVWLTSRLAIRPVLNSVERIRDDSPIKEVGAKEFRYLARAYNKMYGMYKSSMERLNYKASHDELTGAYNRAGYDLLLSGIDLKNTCMMLFDVDNFKSINDTYGHEMGDKILIKMVQVLKKCFRGDDYICRLGGDEFVVIMIHVDKMHDDRIGSVISRVNQAMEKAPDGLPSVTTSVGIAYGSETVTASELLEKADEAMYQSKKNGKNRFTYSE